MRKFEDWLKYQGVHKASLTPEMLTEWRETYQVAMKPPSAKDVADRLRFDFFELGLSYYVSGRAQYFAVRVGPVIGTLFHHAIEMYLKGCLCAFMTPEELKRIGHRLVRLWNRFHKVQPWGGLMRATAPADKEAVGKALLGFRQFVVELDKFEDLRYPDAVRGFTMSLGPTRPSRAEEILIGGRPSRSSHFQLYLEDVDRLVVGLHTAGSVNMLAQVMRLTHGDGFAVLTRDNVRADAWTGKEGERKMNMPPF